MSVLPSTTCGLLAALLGFGAMGCESGRVSAQGEPAESAPRTAAPVATNVAAQPSPSRLPAAGKATTLKLKGGATITIPPEASERRTPAGLPTVVQGAHNFTLPGGERRLLVSELDLEGQTCSARLDAEWATMERARQDTDPERLKLRKTSRVEQRKVAGHRVLYSEALQGTSLADAGRPFAAAASAFMCEGHNLLLIMYMSSRADLAKNVQPLIDGIIASYRPPPG